MDTEQALINIVAARLNDYPDDQLATIQQSMVTLGRVLTDLERRAKDEIPNGVVASVPPRSL
jgi:hypothetical protein